MPQAMTPDECFCKSLCLTVLQGVAPPAWRCGCHYENRGVSQGGRAWGSQSSMIKLVLSGRNTSGVFTQQSVCTDRQNKLTGSRQKTSDLSPKSNRVCLIQINLQSSVFKQNDI